MGTGKAKGRAAFLRDGRNDSDGRFGGTIFTVATVAAVARLIRLRL